MPECLEIVTALRRLNSIDLERLQSSEKSNIERVFAAMELSLQVDFLEARDAWLDQPTNASIGTKASTGGTSHIGATTNNTRSISGKIAVQHSSEQLLDTIERYRTRMFEIATQFNAIFRAKQVSHTTNGSLSSSTSTSSNSSNKIQVSVSLLSMWTSRRVHSFLQILAAQLQLMDDSGSLRDALDASVFFTGSMGRLGADFTAQLPPLFEQKMLAIVLRSWKDGTDQLAETLKICRDAGVASPLFSSTIVTSGTSTTSEHSGVEGEDNDSSSDVMMAPPRQLMALPPLGRLVNACLMGLNELRRCLLPGIFSQLRVAVEKDFLLKTKNILHAHERAVMTPGLRGDATKLREIAKEMKNVTKTIVFPYIRGCVELSLGNELGAKDQFGKLRLLLQPPQPPETVVEEEGMENTPSSPETSGEKIAEDEGVDSTTSGDNGDTKTHPGGGE